VELKPDFEQAAARVEAFWAHDCIGRPALQVLARRAGRQPPPDDADLLTRKTDVEHVVRRAEVGFQAVHYLAEAVPVYIPGLVCSDMAAFLSEDITIMEDTVWYHPQIEDWGSFSWRFDPDNRWWRMTKEMAQRAAQRAQGRFLVGLPDFQVAIDIVSLLRSPERLCLDLIENPAEVQRATRFIMDVYATCYREMRSILGPPDTWVGDWMGLFAPGDHDVVQCDFCALISPRHFAEFCLPDIRQQCQMLERSIFHLDGPDAVKHLDALLEIPELDAIQWVPGAGKPPALGWLPLLRRVQAARKSLYVTSPPEDVEALVEALAPQGLMISVEGAFPSKEEGEQFIRRVERLCAGRC
jgi:hypothetical protein